MPEKKGFTLVELLGVIVILGIVLGLAVVGYIGINNHIKKTYYNGLEESVLVAGNEYYNYNKEKLPKMYGDNEEVEVEELIRNKYIEEIKNRSGESCTGYVGAYKKITEKVNYYVCLDCGEYKSERDECKGIIDYSEAIQVPNNSICDNKTYNGTEQVVVKETRSDGYTLSNYKGINAGEYRVVAKLLTGYSWNDKTTSDKVVVCKINKANPNVELSENDGRTIVGGEIAFTAKSDQSGSFKHESKTTSVAEVSPSTKSVNKDEEEIVSLRAKKVGSSRINVIFTPSDTINYNTVTKVYQMTVTGGLEKPTSASQCRVITYNGSKQILTKSSGLGYILSGNEGIDAGDYTVTAKLTSGYTWSDKTTNDVTFTCKINKAVPTITLDKDSLEVLEGGTKTFKEKANIAGDFQNESLNSLIATVSPTTNENVESNTKKTETVTGVSEGIVNVKVTFTPTDTNNYEVANKTIGIKVYKVATTPTDELCVPRTYNGSAQNLTSVTGGNGYDLDGFRQKNAGTYTISGILKIGYKWSDNTSDPKTFTCSIDPAEPNITVNPLEVKVGVGKKVAFTEKSSNTGYFKNTSGDTSIATAGSMASEETAAGETLTWNITGVKKGNTTVTVTFTPKSSNYKVVTKTINVEVLTPIDPPSKNLCIERTYNKEEQVLVAHADQGGYTLSGYRGTDAKDYSITATLKSGYIWSDNTTGTKTLTCSIDPAEPTLTVNPTSVKVGVGKKVAFTEKSSNTGYFRNTSSDTSIATVGSNGSEETAAGETLTWNITGVKKGNTTVTVTFTPKSSNYKVVTKTINVEVLTPIDPPSKNLCIERTYNKEEQVLVAHADQGGYTLSGYRGTDAKDYSITATLKSGYIWSDNTTGTKTLTCSIDPAEPNITVNPTSVKVGVGKKVEFTEKSSNTGYFKNTSSDTSIATVGSMASEETAAGETLTWNITGVKKGNTTITVTFTPKSSNYKVVTKTINVEVLTLVDPPASSLCIARTYTGSEQVLVAHADQGGYTLSGYKGTNAKDYSITATLKSGYIWSDNTTGTKTLTCSIEKASESFTITKTTATYDGKAHSATITNTSGLAITETYYTDSSCSTKTTAANSGSSGSGLPPVNPKSTSYYVIASTKGNDNYSAGTSSCKAGVLIGKVESTINYSISGETYEQGYKTGAVVTVTCSSFGGISSFTTTDDSNTGTLTETTNTSQTRTITLNSSGNRTIDISCTGNYGKTATESLSYTVYRWNSTCSFSYYSYSGSCSCNFIGSSTSVNCSSNISGSSSCKTYCDNNYSSHYSYTGYTSTCSTTSHYNGCWTTS